MNLIKFFSKEAEEPHGFLMMTVALSGMSSSILLIVINEAAAKVADRAVEFNLFFIFLVAFTLFVYTQHYSLSKIIATLETIVLNIRLRIADKLRHTELQYVEQNGIAKLYTQLIHNTDVLSNASNELSLLVQSIFLVVVSLLYLGWLSPIGLLLYCLFFVIGSAAYLSYNREVATKLSETYAHETEFLDTLDHIFRGFKELKLNQQKNDAVYDELKKVAYITKALKVEVSDRQSVLMVYGRAIFYVLLAAMTFVLPLFFTAYVDEVYKLVATNLFIMGPISLIVSSVPMLNRVKVAVNKLTELENELDAAIGNKNQLVVPYKDFDTIKLEGISFYYKNKEQDVLFSVKNIDFTLQRGEMVFIIGGNGSGKSTLLKLITGLYYPDEGHILLDDGELGPSAYRDYRQLFATIFTDFHLFNKLYGLVNVDTKQVEILLKKVELQNKTRYADGKFTHTDLSTGQRKRLAFITAYLEDKPIYVFDELAADQDPSFRRRFYEEILPELKALGKTIVAVTHDDKYFDVADRVIKMDSGKISVVSEF